MARQHPAECIWKCKRKRLPPVTRPAIFRVKRDWGTSAIFKIMCNPLEAAEVTDTWLSIGERSVPTIEATAHLVLLLQPRKEDLRRRTLCSLISSNLHLRKFIGNCRRLVPYGSHTLWLSRVEMKKQIPIIRLSVKKRKAGLKSVKFRKVPDGNAMASFESMLDLQF